MTHQVHGGAERRVAPRHQMSFAAEFASGTVLVPVTARDLAETGCGMVIMGGHLDLSDKVGSRGLLHLPAVDRGSYGTILPVLLRHVRSEGRQVVYGLEFGSLLVHQARKLMGVLDGMRRPDDNDTTG